MSGANIFSGKVVVGVTVIGDRKVKTELVSIKQSGETPRALHMCLPHTQSFSRNTWNAYLNGFLIVLQNWYIHEKYK